MREREYICPNCGAPILAYDRDDEVVLGAEDGLDREQVEVLVHEAQSGRGSAVIDVIGAAASGFVATLLVVWLMGFGCS